MFNEEKTKLRDDIIDFVDKYKNELDEIQITELISASNSLI